MNLLNVAVKLASAVSQPLELDICVVRGESNNEIAKSLDITENTVKIHLRNILEKLHLQNRIQAAISVVHQHIVRDPYDVQP